MVRLNRHYLKLSGSYLFSEIDERVAALPKGTPLLRLGVGDFTRPVMPLALQALKVATDELGDMGSFKGYGPCPGYGFLREAISRVDYPGLGVSAEDVFISDGACNDLCDIQELFGPGNRIAVLDPTYPAYVDSAVMGGRTRGLLASGRYGGIEYVPCTEANGFSPGPPERRVDLMYVCSPNNPTGVGLTRETLAKWVEKAREWGALILFDGAYEAYVRSPDVPRSIYEIPGADEVAIEARSFSKSAGFTGIRCSYLVVPGKVQVEGVCVRDLWLRRVDTKTNGVSYPIQRAAEALYTDEGQQHIREATDAFLAQAQEMGAGLRQLGYQVFGGVDAPYLWCRAPKGMSSWQFFDRLLHGAQIVAIPGRGFGLSGEGFVRFSGFAPQPVIQEALKRMGSL